MGIRSAASVALVVTILASNGALGQFVETELVFQAPIDSRLSVPNLGGSAGMILITGRSGNGSKHMALHEVTENGRVETGPWLAADLPPEALFFDTGVVSNETKLYFLGPAGVSEYDLAKRMLVPIVEMQSLYRTPSNDALDQRDFLFDVNEDGLEDIVLPDFSGIRVALQTANGFDSAQLLRLPPRLSLGGEGPRYLADSLLHYDFDLDGDKDLAVLRDREFLVFARDGAYFSHDARVLPVEIAVAADSTVDEYDQSVTDIDQSDYQLKALSHVEDLNDDQLPDIVTFTTISSGLFEKRSEYEVHLGRMGHDGVIFDADADALIASDGYQVDLVTVDTERDGGQDLVSSWFRIGFGELITALFSRRVNMYVGLYRMSESPIYPIDPSFQIRVKISFSLSTGFVNHPAILFADFDGDKHTDLLVQEGSEGFVVRRGSGEDFEPPHIEWSTLMPHDGELVEAVDVNNDSRQDLLIGYGRGDGEDMRNRVRVLVSDPETAR